MKYLKQVNSWRQKVDERLPRPAGKESGGHCSVVAEFLFGVIKEFWS